MPAALITGGTGFLGGALARACLERGYEVRLMGRDFLKAGPLLAAGAQAARTDLRDRDGVIGACEGRDVVFHAGALSAPWGDPAEFFEANVAGTENVLEGCRRHGVGRLVHVSSPSVVFDGSDQSDLTDDAPYPVRFASEYSRTKKLAEDRVNAAFRDGAAGIILRPKAVFGPGDTSLLPRLIAAARAGRLPLIGDGRNRVELTYVDNVVQALLLAAEAPDAALGGTYTVTNQEPVRLWDVIADVLGALKIPWKPRRLPVSAALAIAAAMEAQAAVTGREPLLTRYSVRILARTQTYDSARARGLLGYRPQISLSEGLSRTIAALR